MLLSWPQATLIRELHGNPLTVYQLYQHCLVITITPLTKKMQNKQTNKNLFWAKTESLQTFCWNQAQRAASELLVYFSVSGYCNSDLLHKRQFMSSMPCFYSPPRPLPLNDYRHIDATLVFLCRVWRNDNDLHNVMIAVFECFLADIVTDHN